MLIYFSNSELRNETVVIQLMVADVHSHLVKLGAGPQHAQLGSPLQRTSSASSSLPSPSVGITAVTGIVPMPDAMKKACRILLRHCLVREPLLNARGQNGQKRGSGILISYSHRPLQLAFDVIFRAACEREGSDIQFGPIAKTYSLPKGVSCTWTRYCNFDACLPKQNPCVPMYSSTVGFFGQFRHSAPFSIRSVRR